MSAPSAAEQPPADAIDVILEEPFRVLFPLGFLAGVAGVVPWLAWAVGWAPQPSGLLHGLLQMQVFELCIATGFLMTAVPRFLETKGTRHWELGVAVLLAAALLGALLDGTWRDSQWVALALGAHVSIFCLRRLRGRGDDPPPFFGLLLAGFIAAVAGPALLLFPVPELPRVAEALIAQAVMLPFVMAVGSHLGPRLLHGHRGFPETTTPAAHRRLALLTLAGLILLATFPLAAWFPLPALVLRAAIVTAYLIGVLGVHRRLWKPWLHLHLLRASLLAVCAGLWLAALWPGHMAGVLHVTYLGGFGLMTVLIATRVVTGHCDLEAWWDEAHSGVTIPASLVALALPVRLAAEVAVTMRVELVGLASLLWTAGLCLWLVRYVPRLGPTHVTPD